MIEEAKISFEEVNDDINTGRGVRLYHCTKPKTWESLVKTGFDREFLAENSAIYGSGAYTTFDLKSSINNAKHQSHIYGNIIVECYLVDGFKNFIFFDEAMNQKYNGGKPMFEQLKELLPKDMFERVMNSNSKDFILNRSFHTSYANNNHGEGIRTAPRLSALLDVIAPFRDGARTDRYLSNTKVRGYVFRGNNDGNVAVVRDFKAVIPVRISKDYGKTWINVFKKENYDNITGQEDAIFKFLGKYPETYQNEKTINGFCRVKKNGKFNYVNARTDEELLPEWADSAYPFDSSSKRARFTIGNETFTTNGKDFFTEKGERLDRDGLVSYLNGRENETEDNGELNMDNFDFSSLFESIVKESLVQENIESEATDVSFDDFKNTLNSGNVVRLWHCTDGQGLKGILNGGTDPEYRSGEALGRGVYCSYELDSARHNRHSYGPYIFEFVLVGGLKNFLFYTSRMNQKYNGGKSLDEQYRDLLPEYMYLEMKRNHPHEYERACYMDNDSGSVSVFLKQLIPLFDNSPRRRYYENSNTTINNILSKTKVRGWVVDYWCGRSVIVRDYKALVPVRYSNDGYTWKDCLTQENYEKIASAVDSSIYRGKYPETFENEKAACGFLRVKKNGKFNYINVKTDEELLPVWADSAFPFDPQNGRAKFEINGETFTTDGDTIKTKNGEKFPLQELESYLNRTNEPEKADDIDFNNFDFSSLFEVKQNFKKIYDRIDKAGK